MTLRVVAKRAVVAVAVAAVLASCLWGAGFLQLALSGDDGPLPPRWRVPVVPAGVTVVEDTKMCGSGGCWWSLTLQPVAGQTPEELAREMGVASERVEPMTLTDPGRVTVGSNIRAGRVVVYVGYH